MTGRAPSVSLVHDYLLTMRGAERTFLAMAECWPEAPIYTTLYSETGTERRFAGRSVRTSFVQRLGLNQRNFRRALPLYPFAVKGLDLTGSDLIVSSSSAFAHGVVCPPGSVHVCYCHNPFRYAWHASDVTLAELPALARPVLRPGLAAVRRWDRRAARRVTHYVANSAIVRDRLRRYYGREAAAIVHPPVDVDRFRVGDPGDYFLTVTQLVRHKCAEVAIDAAGRAGVRLKVVGGGPELASLRARAPHGVELLGRVSDEALVELYAGARALLLPGVEEFGIAAVEAQAAGLPVIAVGRGGVCETVLDGVTGILLEDDGADAFARVIRQGAFDNFDARIIRRHALDFSPEKFRSRLRTEVDRLYALGGPSAHPGTPA